jgi:hypothetical protein
MGGFDSSGLGRQSDNYGVGSFSRNKAALNSPPKVRVDPLLSQHTVSRRDVAKDFTIDPRVSYRD